MTCRELVIALLIVYHPTAHLCTEDVEAILVKGAWSDLIEETQISSMEWSEENA